MLAGTKLLKKRQPKKIKRTRTTTLTDYGVILSNPPRKPSQTKRILSPTRRQNPHPVGLNYQSPMQADGQAYAIWKPDFNQIRTRYNDMINSLDLTNFSCGPHPTTSPWEIERAGPPEIQYSLKSTSRASFQDPNLYPGLAGLGIRKRITRSEYAPDDGLVIGLVPYSLPKILKGKHIINVEQGENTIKDKDEEKDNMDDVPLNNTAYRTIWRCTGLRPVIGCQY